MASSAARLMGLTPIGTVFVLVKGLERKNMNLDEFLEMLDELMRQCFRLREEVYLDALREARK